MIVQSDPVPSTGPPLTNRLSETPELHVLLTGFGPFARSDGSQITANPSFAAIAPLKDTLYTTSSGRSIRFTTLEVPVSYEDVERVVPGLHHGGYDFIIHLGVGRNGFITLEQRAHSGGYYKRDIHGREGPLASRCMYVTKWDVHHLVHQLTQLGLKDVIVSDDAGRYLCEYIYFRSLEESVNSGIPVLFVHVPQEGKPFSIAAMTAVVLRLVALMADVKESDLRDRVQSHPN